MLFLVSLSGCVSEFGKKYTSVNFNSQQTNNARVLLCSERTYSWPSHFIGDNAAASNVITVLEEQFASYRVRPVQATWVRPPQH